MKKKKVFLMKLFGENSLEPNIKLPEGCIGLMLVFEGIGKARKFSKGEVMEVEIEKETR